MRFRYSYRKKAKLFANSGDPDQTPHSAASDLGLHCLPVTHLGVSRLQWVNCWYTTKVTEAAVFSLLSCWNLFSYREFLLVVWQD